MISRYVPATPQQTVAASTIVAHPDCFALFSTTRHSARIYSEKSTRPGPFFPMERQQLPKRDVLLAGDWPAIEKEVEIKRACRMPAHACVRDL